MTVTQTQLTAAEHARTMAGYIEAGTAAAMALGNRGPLRLGADGKLDPAIVEAYWRTGFYVFEDVIGPEELADLRQDVDRALAAAPAAPDAGSDPRNPSARIEGLSRPAYRYAKPLSDPLGGTDLNKGRHPVRMLDPAAADGAPDWTVNLLDGNLQLMDACLRLYGHPGLLAVAEAVNGPDFVPYNEVPFIKEPGLGPSVAWHQDGTTHWTAEDWDAGAHGFNFMTQLYPSTAANCVWALPGSHARGKADIKALIAESGSERLEGAVPMLSGAGDVMILNRQIVHGSFANTSPDRRVTLNAGFFPLRRVLNVETSNLRGQTLTYTAGRIETRSRIIQLAIDARRQRYPDEPSYRYAPLAHEAERIRWSETARAELLRNYNEQDMYI